MVPYNTYGLLLLIPSIGLGVFFMIFLEDTLKSWGINDGVGIGIVFLLIFFIASLLALLFDRSDKKGVIGCYKQLWNYNYYGEKSHPKTRSALFFMPLAFGPFSCFLIGISIWLIDIFHNGPQLNKMSFLIYFGLCLSCIVFNILFAIFTQNIRLIRPETDQKNRTSQ